MPAPTTSLHRAPGAEAADDLLAALASRVGEFEAVGDLVAKAPAALFARLAHATGTPPGIEPVVVGVGGSSVTCFRDDFLEADRVVLSRGPQPATVERGPLPRRVVDFFYQAGAEPAAAEIYDRLRRDGMAPRDAALVAGTCC